MDEDKHTALVVMGIVVILAILGILLVAKTIKTQTPSEVIVPVSEVTEQPSFAEKSTVTQKQIQTTQKITVTEQPAAVQSYSWAQKPTTSIKYGETIKTCRELTFVGTVQSGYTVDAGLAGTTSKDCVRVDGSLQGFCCRP